MSITEEQRHQLIRALERELGQEEAAALMAMVPSIPWSEFATKRDLDDLAARMELRLDHQDALWRADFGRLEASVSASVAGVAASVAGVEASVGSLEARTEAMIADAVNRLTFRMLPAMATMITIFGAIAALF